MGKQLGRHGEEVGREWGGRGGTGKDVGKDWGVGRERGDWGRRGEGLGTGERVWSEEDKCPSLSIRFEQVQIV